MADFHSALLGYRQAAAVERAIEAACPKEIELGDDYTAAASETNAAFDRLFAIPSGSISQASAKLCALAAHHDIAACGCDADAAAMLVAEVARFAASAALACAPAAERSPFQQKLEAWAIAEQASDRFEAEVYEPLAQRVAEAVAAIPHVEAQYTGHNGEPSVLTTAKQAHVTAVDRVLGTTPRVLRIFPLADNEFHRACRKIRVAHRRRERVAQRLRDAAGIVAAVERSNALNDAANEARWAAIECPSRDLIELVAKLEFIKSEPSDAAEELLTHIEADVRRLAGVA